MVGVHPDKIVTGEETARLLDFCTQWEVENALEAARAVGSGENDALSFDYIMKLSAAYMAGRVQGIREERAKRRAGA